MRTTLVEMARSAVRKQENSFFAKYYRFTTQRAARAAVAIGQKNLLVVHHLLAKSSVIKMI